MRTVARKGRSLPSAQAGPHRDLPAVAEVVRHDRGQSVDGFGGLAEQVRQHLRHDPLSGHVFVFRNQRGDRLKLLSWDEDGVVIVYKRLEQGTFRWPAVAEGQASVTLRAAELTMLLDGVDWQKVQRSRRYHRPATATV